MASAEFRLSRRSILTSAYIFDRLEWETEIKGDKLDLKAAARTPVGDVLHGSRA